MSDRERVEMPVGGDRYLKGAVNRAAGKMKAVALILGGAGGAGWNTDAQRIEAVPTLIADLRAELAAIEPLLYLIGRRIDHGVIDDEEIVAAYKQARTSSP